MFVPLQASQSGSASSGKAKGQNSGKGPLLAPGRLSVRLSAQTAAPPPSLRLPCASQRPDLLFLIMPFSPPCARLHRLRQPSTALAALHVLHVATPALRYSTVTTARREQASWLFQTALKKEAALLPKPRNAAFIPPHSPATAPKSSGMAACPSRCRCACSVTLIPFQHGGSNPTQSKFYTKVAAAPCPLTPLEDSLRQWAKRRSLNSNICLAFGPLPLVPPLHSAPLHNLTCNGTERAEANFRQVLLQGVASFEDSRSHVFILSFPRPPPL